ncbi:MAG: thiamine-phosphate kinase [Planctomycetaceae bacterium]
MANEFELIVEWQRASRPHAAVELGIGDDTAILNPLGTDGRTLVTVDLIAEGTHFAMPPATPADVGRKALGVNLSDIAAMAGRPEAAFVAVLLPRRLGADCARELVLGMRPLADEYGVAIAGGDTNVWDGPLVVSVTLLGSCGCAGAVRRSGAQSGDWLFVTGALGGSLFGRHLHVQPRIREALELSEAVDLHAMLDLSDGLSRDLPHLTIEQGLGAILLAERIPIHADVPATQSADQRLTHALNDGEDFELLFAVSPEDGQRLLERNVVDLPLSHIGEVTTGPAVCQLQQLDGRLVPLPAAGYEHQF